MWRKRHLPLFFVLFWCLSCASQSWAQSTWDDFDQILQDLRNETESLSLKLTEAQKSLTELQAELQTQKAQSQKQALLLRKYADSLTLSKQSLLTCENDLRASHRLNIILIITQVMSLIGIGALLL